MTNFNSGGGDPPDWDLDMEPRGLPDGIKPTPASDVSDLRGRRVIMGLPGLGWRRDLRADAAIVQGSRTYIPVLNEQEWYRAEAERTEVFAPLVPIERVWVEVLDKSIGESFPPNNLVSRLVSLDFPPTRIPTPASIATNTTGLRMIKAGNTVHPDLAHQRDLRAVTEPYTTNDGDICVRVCNELDWYRWAWNGQPPKTLSVPVHFLWLE